MTSVAVPAASNPMRPVLPNRGSAIVKSVLSGDTVVLLGRATTPGGKPPEVLFTFERVTAPRMASKINSNLDDFGAFPSREYLRDITVGKTVWFETRKQGATAGDRVYGLLFQKNSLGEMVNLAVEAVKLGFATPKFMDKPVAEDEEPTGDEYDVALREALDEAKREQRGVHSPSPVVRLLKNAGEDFETLQLVERSKLCSGKTIKCVVEHIFDGSRYRCLVTDSEIQGLQYASFTLILAGVAAPRTGNPRLDPPTLDEPYAVQSKTFVELRLLHRELEIGLHGCDKSGVCAVGTVHHPRGNIGVELLKNGHARVSDWSARMMSPLDVPAFRIAENEAKRTNKGIWHSYAPPQLVGASVIVGTVVEVVTGDTLSILPQGESYDSETKLKKVSLASVRCPRVGSEKSGKVDEPYSFECKDRLRVLTVGKSVRVNVNYEREIPIGGNTERRQFGTVSVGKREDVGEVLVQEGLAETQRHRDDDEKSPRYDYLVAAEATAKAAKKNLHATSEYGRRSVNDLSDPRKSKAYAGSLMRAGSIKAVVEYVFNGSRFKIFVPNENCSVVFALENLRCPQPSPNVNSRNIKPSEPFGDESKRHARLTLLQRSVEISCKGVTAGGVITGSMFVGNGGQRREYAMELVSAGLATVDARKIEYGEAPRMLVDAQNAATKNRVGIWSLEQKEMKVKTPTTAAKKQEQLLSISLTEIRSGSHFYFSHNAEAAKIVDASMAQFTSNNGTAGAPCDTRPNKIAAALFDDGTGKRWYRAKIVEKPSQGKVGVLFLDYGNVSKVPIATHLRPLDITLGPDRIPPVAKEGELVLIKTRSTDDDEGIDAARLLQNLAWGKQLTAHIHCEIDNKSQITLMDPGDTSGNTINEHLIIEGLARVVKTADLKTLSDKMISDENVKNLWTKWTEAQELARKRRKGIWRYGDVGEDDEE